MEIQHVHTSKWCEVWCAFRFAWANQKAIFTRLACPLLFMATYFIIIFTIQYLAHGGAQVTGPDGMTIPMINPDGSMTMPTTMPMVQTPAPWMMLMMFAGFVLMFMASLMMPVRLYRFMFSKEDAFFSFGRREMRMLWNAILVLLSAVIPAGALGFLFSALNFPAVGGILGVITAVLLMMALSFLFPALSIDRPTSFKLAWTQMRDVYGSFVLTILMLVFFSFLATVVAMLLPGIVVLALVAVAKENMSMFLPYVMPLGLAYYLWFGTILGATKTRIVSNFYQRQVLDKE